MPGLSSLLEVFETLRRGIEDADAAEEIETLVRRGAWLVKLVNAPAWAGSFGDDLPTVREAAAGAYAETVRVAARRAADLGVEIRLD